MENRQEICPKYEGCPIYKQKTVDEYHAELYKLKYCKAGKEKYETCKRYIVAQKTGKAAPGDIMPNSFYTVDEIIQIMKEQGIIL